MRTNIAWWRAAGALTLACALAACGGGNAGTAGADMQKTEARATGLQATTDPSEVHYAP